MTQGEMERLAGVPTAPLHNLEVRIMEDIVRRIRINGFSTASADWQITRLQQLGMAEQEIKDWIRDALEASDEEIDRIFSDKAYEEYMKQKRGYDVYGREQIPFEDNAELQQMIEAMKQQTKSEFSNFTGSLGFVKEDPSGRLHPVTLSDFYRQTLDDAMMDIHSGAFDYNTVLRRTIDDMTKSGLRHIDYASGHHNRVPVAARRAVLTGFRQIQGKINEQTARALGTDSYEVTVHIGARPTHQVWEGKVWTMEQLRTVCGLGSVTGLCGANCYHMYDPFIPGVSVRTYTDDQLDAIHKQENTPKTYNGKEYTTYEALQRQRKLETRARKYREDVHLLEEGGGSEDDIIAKKCRYQGVMQEYKDFSKKMDLPMQKERIYQDGLKVKMEPRVEKKDKPAASHEDSDNEGDIKDGIRRLSKGIRSGETVVGFEDLNPRLKIDFKRGLKTSSVHIKDVLEKEAKEADYIVSSGTQSYYSHHNPDNTVVLGQKADSGAMAHELFHRIDERYKVSKHLTTALQNDYVKLYAASGGNIKRYLVSVYPNAFETSPVTGKLKFKKEYRGISDILNGLSKGAEHYGYGHPTKYWQTPGALEKESFAQFGRIQFDNDRDVMKMFETLFPDFEKDAILALKGVK